MICDFVIFRICYPMIVFGIPKTLKKVNLRFNEVIYAF